MRVFAVVSFQDQDTPNATECRHVAVARVTVQPFAALCAVQNVAVQVTNVRANWRPIVGIGRILRVLDCRGKQIAFKWDSAAVLRPHIHHCGSVAVSHLFQLVLVHQRDVAGAVVEDGCPLVRHIQMNRAVSTQVHGESPHISLYKVEMIAVGLHVYAAIEQVRGVGIGRDGYRIATAIRGVDTPCPRAEIEAGLVHLAALQVYHGHLAFFAVADKQTPYHRLAIAMVVLLIVVRAGLGKLYRIDAVA